ncbi:beta-hydroxyacyl-ACP dehydratase [Pseudomonas sp. CAU 1711]|uniref:beta-hydroxyacyl-ACP dehydratase n=1 Tax=Pseudomonas sp. CAU 1711 TaxID=3140356 RepID=UPI0032606833
MDRTQLHTLLPHQGDALWLDALIDHDATRIRGLSAWRHLDKLGSDASTDLLFEAAAQLCAAHGALYGETDAIEMALVGKLSQLQLHTGLRREDAPLLVSARQEAVSPAGARYRFAIHADTQPVLDGTLLLVLVRA